MPAPKLTDEHQDALREWLCGGLSNVACIERLKTDFGVEVTQPAINYYRDKHSDEIAEAEEAAYKHVIQQGMTRRSERIKALATEAERAREALQNFRPGQKGWAQANAEWRAILKDIRDEMRDLTHRIELSGKVDGEFEHSGNLVAQLSPNGRTIELLAALTEQLAGSAPVAGGVDARDDGRQDVASAASIAPEP